MVISLGRALQVGITLISVRMLTDILSKEEVGNLYLINSLAAFFGFTLINPIGMYVNRKMHAWVEEKVFLIISLFIICT